MLNSPTPSLREKMYVLKKDCPNIGKEIGDYYNNEYAESIEELLANGTIEEEMRKDLIRHSWLNLKLIFTRRGTYKWFKIIEEIDYLEKKLNYPKFN